jgi:hypothetical protein
VRGREAAFLESFAWSRLATPPPAARAAARYHAAGGGEGEGLGGLVRARYDAFLRALVRGDGADDDDDDDRAAARAAAAAGAPARLAPPVVEPAALLAPGWSAPAPVVVVPYALEGYRALSARLALWPAHPRGGHAGLARTRHGRAVVLLVDRRAPASDWLPARWRLRLPAGALTVAAAAAGESCDATCVARGSRCDDAQLQWANDCAALRAHFRCEAGCGHQLGDEIPCYVTERGRDTHAVCLHGDAPSKCAARFGATRRLCVCVPADG